ncbi:hypothetical protein P22_1670 [Propionispora sp. 2/2-37]|uniref:16S rRNA (guanine(966)-N(2))-methyltransferase RsmD n=1 Tax=Propionispora sp. 2/2-37 TaxID=1677858 RepID=UPI0006BB8A0C|nr:16S rRNA (guanine(966)-N(2))-methyltransferase RsmD [Propionispora sp. 2/2-37]CUH95596.1 hypothetical protein P22_1670 [Propionispora sp. 2/2-37]
MRIITGSARGTRLKAPRGMDTRPTADRVKESVFNILGSAVIDARVLDLFAGTGNLGLESLSRGAQSAVFVDYSIHSVTAIRENARQTKLSDRTEIYRRDVYKALEKVIQDRRMFDVVFCDPPYNRGLAVGAAQRIDGGNILAPAGILVLEHSRHEQLPDSDNWLSLRVARCERYGETLISFLMNKELPNR